MAGLTFLRPKLISVYRKSNGSPGPDGNSIDSVAQTYENLACMLDHAARGVSDKLEWVEQTGEMVAQTDFAFIDGLMPAQFFGYAPGDSLTVNGIVYVVDAEGTGAFPDIQPFDVVVHGTNRYLVLQATSYVLVEPSLQLHLNFGRAWLEMPAGLSEITVQFLTQGELDISNGSFDVNTAGEATFGATSGWYFQLGSGAAVAVTNAGILNLGGADPTLEGSNAGSAVNVNGGTLTLGANAGDAPELSFGGSAVGIVDVFGTLLEQGNAYLEVGGSGNGHLIIALGATLSFSPTSDASVQLQGNLTINGTVTVPDDNSVTTTAGAILAMFTHAEAALVASFADASYSDGSQGAVVSWAWDFGDSGTSTDQNPSHTYAGAGTYTVTLVATTFNGANSTVTASVTVS